MIRAEFVTPVPRADHPALGAERPYWCGARNDDGLHLVVAYADDIGTILSHWPQVEVKAVEECHVYEFTDAYPVPEWYLRRQRSEVERARLIAEDYHRGQVRRYTGAPYSVHLASVASTVAKRGGTIPMIQAAWLHDAVEMCGATPDDLRGPFGAEVAELVAALSEPPKDGATTRATRKAIYRRQLHDASPAAQTIKLADILDNVTDIADHDPEFATIYLAEKQAEVAVLTQGHAALRRRTTEAVNNALAAFESAAYPSM